jgi:uncharacterized protein YkwD
VLPVLVAVIVGSAAAGLVTLLSGLGNPGSFDPAQVAIASADPRMEFQVVDLVNKERAKVGCQPLIMDDRLTQAAEAHSTDMAERGYFGHTTPEGLNFRDRIRAAGFTNPGVAENLAHGQPDAVHVLAGWMASDEHRPNILNCEFDLIGVGLNEHGMYWTQEFGAI